jgi:hypothetical protein
MAPNRIMRGRAMRSAAPVAAALAALGLAACGGGGQTTTSVPDREGDAQILNQVLGRQLGAVDAYGAVIGGLRGFDLAAARRFRAQEQEHQDAIVKALRGLGAEAAPEAEEIEPEGIKSRADRLRFLYEVESATIDEELSAISKLTASWPRALLGSIVANQAQHLAILRRGLGAGPLAAIPEAFENGTVPLPGE